MMLPFYPFYWGDYSTKTFDLSQGEHGAYMLLLRYVYVERGPIPHERRYSIAKALLEQEQINVDKVLEKYFHRKGDGWYNHKAELVMADAEKAHKARVNAGKKPKKQCSSIAQALPKQPKPELEPVKKEKNNLTVVPKEKRGTRLPDDFEPDATCQAVCDDLWLTAKQSQFEFQKFQDYWKSAPGAKGVKLDWQATFRNWLRNSTTKGTLDGKTANGHRPGSISAGFAELDAAIAEADRREAAGSANFGEAPVGRPS